MQKIDIMGELIKIGLDFIKKQAGIVVVLIFVCLALTWVILEQKRELFFQMNTINADLRKEINDVSERLQACDEARARLVVQVEVLKVRADGLSAQVDELKRKKR